MHFDCEHLFHNVRETETDTHTEITWKTSQKHELEWFEQVKYCWQKLKL